MGRPATLMASSGSCPRSWSNRKTLGVEVDWVREEQKKWRPDAAMSKDCYTKEKQEIIPSPADAKPGEPLRSLRTKATAPPLPVGLLTSAGPGWTNETDPWYGKSMPKGSLPRSSGTDVGRYDSWAQDSTRGHVNGYHDALADDGVCQPPRGDPHRKPPEDESGGNSGGPRREPGHG